MKFSKPLRASFAILVFVGSFFNLPHWGSTDVLAQVKWYDVLAQDEWHRRHNLQMQLVGGERARANEERKARAEAKLQRAQRTNNIYLDLIGDFSRKAVFSEALNLIGESEENLSQRQPIVLEQLRWGFGLPTRLLLANDPQRSHLYRGDRNDYFETYVEKSLSLSYLQANPIARRFFFLELDLYDRQQVGELLRLLHDMASEKALRARDYIGPSRKNLSETTEFVQSIRSTIADLLLLLEKTRNEGYLNWSHRGGRRGTLSGHDLIAALVSEVVDSGVLNHKLGLGDTTRYYFTGSMPFYRAFVEMLKAHPHLINNTNTLSSPYLSKANRVKLLSPESELSDLIGRNVLTSTGRGDHLFWDWWNNGEERTRRWQLQVIVREEILKVQKLNRERPPGYPKDYRHSSEFMNFLQYMAKQNVRLNQVFESIVLNLRFEFERDGIIGPQSCRAVVPKPLSR